MGYQVRCLLVAAVAYVDWTELGLTERMVVWSE